MENKRQIVRSETLPFHEENLMGIPVILKDAAVVETDDAGDETVTIPGMEGLVAAIAVNRCLEPRKLAGGEIRFMRKALGMTQAAFAETLEIDPATVSRWENDGQVLGGFAEKCLRHLVCDTFHAEFPYFDYDPKRISYMKIGMPAQGERIEPMVFVRVRGISDRMDIWGRQAA